jgi:hypothetical protein
MQGSELEKVERNHAELEFSLREKNVTIKQNFAQILNKLENTEENSQEPNLDLIIEIESDLDILQKLIQKEQ